ncbi:MAG TPA: tripartite tricarboxylate transporter substrate binding protein [Caldimonas sp.]|nr:tripartite tricarboxylate transporter substrate binding protein [Caldimonas sp.]
MIPSTKLQTAAIALLLGGLGAVQPVRAEYPEKPVQIIVNAAPGGAADATTRVVAAELARRLGQPFIILNKPGAAGALGLSEVARAAPDGYVIGNNNLATFIVAALTARHLPYRIDQDFTPIAKVFTQPNLVGVTPTLPVKSLSELIAYAKANPGKISYGSTGQGTSLHVLTELLRMNNGLEITHVPYKSAPAAEQDLAAGHIQLMISNFTSMEPQVKAGRIRALAITSPTRSPELPDVPTVAQAGAAYLEMVTWGGLVGPRNLPPAIVKKLNTTINQILSDPKVKKQFDALGSEATVSSVEEFSALIKADTAKWGDVIRKGNITVD